MVYGYNERASHKKKDQGDYLEMDIEFQTKEFLFFTF